LEWQDKSKGGFMSVNRFLHLGLTVLLTFVTAGCNTRADSVSGNTVDPRSSIAEPVNLGLSVKWASFNVGATKPEEYGAYFGWGDVTGEKTSTNNNEYPSANPPKNISGTEYDAAHVLWGDSWRLPTRKEQEELVNKCRWTKIRSNNVEGYRVTGPNGNSIFLSASGGRIGTQVLYQVSGGDFWSGTISENTGEAYYMWFYGGRQAVEDLPRHYGFAIRPVTE
jgi:hypothetical protein